MKRREFIGLVGCATAAPTLAALAQPQEKLPRIGVLNSFVRTDLVAQDGIGHFASASLSLA